MNRFQTDLPPARARRRTEKNDRPSKGRGALGVVLFCLCVLSALLSGVFAVRGQRSTGPAAAASVSVSALSSASSAAPAASASAADGAAASEMRAVWIATTSNINFPSSQGLSSAAQEKEIDAILDKAKAMGLNSVFVQVRPHADALYQSSFYPWSNVLTGTQGKNPGYDPLQYFVAGAHKRGLKLQAWLNPYYIQSKADVTKLSTNNPARVHADWTVKTAEGQLYFNPGLPQVRELIENGVMEIVDNYNVDGIVFDDYFYPDKTFGDAAAFKQYGAGKSLDDWRRANVTALISEIHDKIKAAGKNTVFGVSPFAVWANKSSNAAGSDTSAGTQSYYDQYADTRLWVQKRYLDYICPQIYWKIGYSVADYGKLLPWWESVVKGTGVKLYVGTAVYHVGSNGWTADEIISEMKLAAKSPEYGGSALYGYAQLRDNTLGVTDAIKAYYEGGG